MSINPYEAPQPLTNISEASPAKAPLSSSELTISYDRTLDEMTLLDLAEYLKSDEVGKHLRYQLAVVPLVIAALFTLPYLTSETGSRDWLQTAICGWILAIAYVFWYPWNFKRDAARRLAAMYLAMPYCALAGRWYVSLDPDGLRLKTPVCESWTNWIVVDAPIINDENVTVKLLGSKLVIPRDAFASAEQLDEWAQLVRSHLKS